VTGAAPHPPPSAIPELAALPDLAAVRDRAAESGMSVSEYVREALWRVRSEEAWARALAQAWTEPQGADRRD
jgi:Arc/MetJ-type ribon-helix-helix transcriptional regulator